MCEFGSGPAVALPGGIGISLQKVYDTPAPDDISSREAEQ